MVAAGVAGSLYLERNFLGPGGRRNVGVPRTPNLVEGPGAGVRSASGTTKDDDASPAGRAKKLVESTRSYLDRLEKVSNELPRLKKFVHELEKDQIFGERQFMQGSGFELVLLWRERKEYPSLFWPTELEKRRARFEAAVKRTEEGHARKGDPAIVLQTYEFAGKLLGLPVQNGWFVGTGTPPVGPEAVVEDLIQIEERVSHP